MRFCAREFEGGLEPAVGAGPKKLERQTKGTCRLLNLFKLVRRHRESWVQKNPERCCLRHEIAQQAEPLGFHRDGEVADPRDVAARAVEAGHKATRYGIAAEYRHYWNCLRRAHGGPRSGFAANGSQNRHRAARRDPPPARVTGRIGRPPSDNRSSPTRRRWHRFRPIPAGTRPPSAHSRRAPGR